MYHHLGQIGFGILLCICCILLIFISSLRVSLERTRSDLRHKRMTCDYLQDQVHALQRDGSAMSVSEVSELQKKLKRSEAGRKEMDGRVRSLSAELGEVCDKRDELSFLLAKSRQKLASCEELIRLKPEHPEACWYGSRIFSHDTFCSVADRIPDFPGVYVIRNETSDRVFVQCSERTAKACVSHFRKQGSIDIWADMAKGHLFTVRMVPFSGSGYDSLSALCSEVSIHHNVYFKGYRGSYGK